MGPWRIFCDGTISSFFATLVCGRLEQNGSVTICNAGHCRPLHLHRGGIAQIVSTGLPLGLFREAEYGCHNLKLAPGDTLNRAAWYDGRTVTVLDKEHNVYATIEAPATIDATFDKLEDEYGVVLPLADLLYADPYAVLMAGVTYGRYLGLHQAAGVECHHLAFSQERIEWQVWIDAGDKPLPRKLVISYVQEPGEPQYSAVIRRWNLESKVPDGLFTFEAPEGAQKIDAKAFARSGAENATPPETTPKGGR